MTNILDSKSLHDILKEIFKVDDEHIVFMAHGTYVPQVEKENMGNETYIGYRIMTKRVDSQKEISASQMQVYLKISFRIAFAGPDAEKFINQVLFWKYNPLVKDCFKKYHTTINFDNASVFSYSEKNLDVWDVDFSAESVYEAEYAGETFEHKVMTQENQIASCIEEYIEKFVKAEITLTASEISIWPVVEKICKNIQEQDICKAMKSVQKYEGEHIAGEYGSATFKMQYKKRRVVVQFF